MRAKGKKIRRVASGAESKASADAGAVFAGSRSSSPGPRSSAPGPRSSASASHASGNGAPPAPARSARQADDAPERSRDENPAASGRADPSGRDHGRRSLKNWRVRSRLLLLVAIPTVTALIFGGLSIFSSVRSAQAFQRVGQLAALGRDVTALVQSLEDERDQTVYYIALGANGGRADALSRNPSLRADAAPQITALRQQWARTDSSATKVRDLAAQIGSSYPAQTQQAAGAMLDALDQSQLSSLRTASTGSQLPLLIVAQKYSDAISTALGFNTDIAEGAGDATLTQTVGVLGLVSVMKQDASQQRAILAAALIQGRFGPGELTALQNSVASQQASLQAFNAAATPGQHQLWNSSVSRSSAGQASSDELQALSLAASSRPAGSLGTDPTTPDDWYGAQSNTIRSQMGSVEQQLVGSVISRAGTLHRNAIISASIVGAAILLVLALAMLFTIIVGRSMVRPLRRLRVDALNVAGVRLPEMVRRLSESEGEEQGQLKVQPIDVDSTDEIGEVARAFDQVHAEAVRLASNEARLRGNVNAMFVNLSRRSQSLVERQIHLIDDLEQGEQDSDRLGSLFRLDHLATRMRRNSENLLVLAGHEAARRWTQPVALVDVLRAAVSEIEHYERVVLNVQPGIAVRGQVVNDVVHLLAELVENATAFSSAQTQVNVSGHLLNSGGVLLDITDQGVGMAADEMAQANWRLDNPPVVDVAASRRMGLFVVARLASRHGIRVRLRPAASGGLTALIWLPDETVTHEEADRPSGLRRFELDAPAASVPVFGLEQFSTGGLDGIDGRAAAQAAVDAARAPRFTAIGPGTGDPQPAGPAQATGDDDPVAGRDKWSLPGSDSRPPPEPGAGPPLPRRRDGVRGRQDGLPGLGDGLPKRDEGLAGLGDGLLEGRGDGLPGLGDGLPGVGDGLPGRGADPLPRRRDSSLLPSSDSLPARDNGSQPDPDHEPERVFGAPIAGLANGLAAPAPAPAPAPAAATAAGPPAEPGGDEPDSALGRARWSDPDVSGADTFPGDANVTSAQAAGEEGRAAHLRVGRIRLVPPGQARCWRRHRPGTGRGGDCHRLGLSRRRRLARGRSGRVADFGRRDPGGPAQARPAGQPGSRWRGRGGASTVVRRGALGRGNQGAAGELPAGVTKGPCGAGRRGCIRGRGPGCPLIQQNPVPRGPVRMSHQASPDGRFPRR